MKDHIDVDNVDTAANKELQERSRRDSMEQKLVTGEVDEISSACWNFYSQLRLPRSTCEKQKPHSSIPGKRSWNGRTQPERMRRCQTRAQSKKTRLRRQDKRNKGTRQDQTSRARHEPMVTELDATDVTCLFRCLAQPRRPLGCNVLTQDKGAVAEDSKTF
jgi:hypothetical protein